jgi:hypothetical protein
MVEEWPTAAVEKADPDALARFELMYLFNLSHNPTIILNKFSPKSGYKDEDLRLLLSIRKQLVRIKV